MTNVKAVVSSIRNIMRQDRGISGDAQRLEQLGWMLFLKIIDDKDKELEILKDDYTSVIPSKLQWRTWAENREGITGDDLLNFIDNNSEGDKGLFATLQDISSINNPKRAAIVKEVFQGSNNYMKSGFEMRKVINKLNEINFNNSKDKHLFGDIYESILQELRDAGNKGEFYTPRAVTQFMTQMTNPALGEKILDPAAGTGGFLISALEHVRKNSVNTVDDENILQNSIFGWELKPVAHILGLTNLILHDIDVPEFHYMDSLKKEYNSITKKDQVDVILANPPFGARIADGVETNFPQSLRCRESADLFLVLMLRLLNSNGRAAIILPDGCIKGEGVKARIHEKLLNECNVHTIIRMPTSTFFPAAVRTNLIFFDKGTPTKDIWYYEHKLPVGQKSYSKTKPIQFSEFEPIIEWWNNRIEHEVAWKVNIDNIIDFDLDVKNPNEIEIKLDSSEDLLLKYDGSKSKFNSLLLEIQDTVLQGRHPLLNKIIRTENHLLKNRKSIELLKRIFIQEAICGNLSIDFRTNLKFNKDSQELKKGFEKQKEKHFINNGGGFEKGIEYITENNAPYPIPDSWTWCVLDEIALFKNGKAHEQIVDPNGDYILVNSKFVSTNGGTMKNCKELLTPLEVNDIAIVMSDVPNGRALSRCYHVQEDNRYTLNQRIGGITPLEGVFPEYLNFVLDRNHFYLSFNDGKKQTNIKKSQILSCPIPIPSYKEQIEIANKIESLINNCNNLLEIIDQNNYDSELLMQAILNEAFEGKKEEKKDELANA